MSDVPEVNPGDTVQVWDWRQGRFNDWDATSQVEEEDGLFRLNIHWRGSDHHHYAFWTNGRWEEGCI